MSKVIIKHKGYLCPEELEWIEARIDKDLENRGFTVLDDNYDIIVIKEAGE